MAAVAVLPPSGTKTAVGAEEQMDVDVQASTPAAAEEDLYTRLKTLQRQLEFLEIQVGIMLTPLEVGQQTLAAVSVCVPCTGMTTAVGLHGVLQLNSCRVTGCSGR
jgi:hypothetical protein